MRGKNFQRSSFLRVLHAFMARTLIAVRAVDSRDTCSLIAAFDQSAMKA